MRELFVSQEIAESLKNNFDFTPDIPLGMYIQKDLIWVGEEVKDTSALIFPTYQQVTDWFREEHKIDVLAVREEPGINSWLGLVTSYKNNSPIPHIRYPCQEQYEKAGGTYYQALNSSIEFAILLLIRQIKS